MKLSACQTKADDSADVIKQLERDCRQNNLSRALFCMQKARLMQSWYDDDVFPKNCVEACPFSLYFLQHFTILLLPTARLNLLNCDDIIFRINSSDRFVILRTHLNATLLFISDCGILQFTLFPKLEQTGTAHSLITHLKSTNEMIILFMIIVAQFYLFYISSYYLVFSL